MLEGQNCHHLRLSFGESVKYSICLIVYVYGNYFAGEFTTPSHCGGTFLPQAANLVPANFAELYLTYMFSRFCANYNYHDLMHQPQYA